MDKIVINAVAGSGKTSFIIDSLNLEAEILIITYTRANQKIIQDQIVEKFGYFPNNINLYGLYSFLFSFCLRPIYKRHINLISYEKPSPYAPDITSDSNIYSNRISKLLLEKFPTVLLRRINCFFDVLYVDEMQDFGSDDFDLMMSFSQLEIPVFLVGDFYQHTFSTSTRGNKGKNIYADFKEYNLLLEKSGYLVDLTSLAKSYRCTINVCDFVTNKCKIPIFSNSSEQGDVVFIDDTSVISEILNDDKIVKLFYQKHYMFSCYSDNWGNSKGQTFDEVCVVLNQSTFQKFQNDTLHSMPPSTLAKFYVACTRSRGNIYLISEKRIPKEFKM